MTRLVLCPGSRSGPLAAAAGLLAARGDLALTTAIDERSAAFLALGMATARGRAVAVVTTSGTAVANLLPAAVEADRSSQPLLLLTADRPARLKNCGANQTVNQEQFLQPVCRWLGHGAPEGLASQPPQELLDLANEAWQHCHGRPPGPVQLNLPFEEPLHGSPEDQLLPQVSGLQRSAAAASIDLQLGAAPQLDPNQAGVVVAGPWRGLAPALPAYQQALRQWLARSGWLLLADPLAAIPADCPGQLDGWELQLDRLQLAPGSPVLRLGPLPASRRLEAWLHRQTGPQLLISEGEPRGLDPLGLADQWSGGLAAWWAEQNQDFPGASTPEQLMPQSGIASLLRQRLPLQGAVNEPALAHWLPLLLPPQLPVMLAASSPVRDWLIWGGLQAQNRRCFSFRGASGIDGTLSLAMGLAVEQGPMVLVTGDLALLHDSNGWLHGAQGNPPLLVLLIDNQGGGIFQQLPIQSKQFDRLFAMPQRVNPLALAAAHGIDGRQVACLEDLPEALEWGLAQGRPALLRLATDREADARLRTQLRSAAQNAEPLL
ncbi:2-succinyl-5-enolpyruvyl-6-hydroxy-3- cyclohexene-1-carboxylic-acid synthase [Synechococcus sp. A18-40]|nr:2-succinyl-5-enolpyruvyl-6-hydroxy-3- cyclohexene-1-carboxylic-acid synthase [Synechococcus sp. A18-40]